MFYFDLVSQNSLHIDVELRHRELNLKRVREHFMTPVRSPRGMVKMAFKDLFEWLS